MFTTSFRLPKISLSLSKFLQMRFNSFLFRFLPFSVSRCYVMVLGKLYYLLNWKDKILIRKTIEHVFRRKIPAPILKKKIKAAFRGIFDHYHEKLFVGYSNFPKLLKFLKSQVRFEGQRTSSGRLGERQGGHPGHRSLRRSGDPARFPGDEWFSHFHDLPFPNQPAAEIPGPAGRIHRPQPP